MDRQDRPGTMRHAGVAASSPTRAMWTVQALRGVASLMVVIGHSQSAVAGVVGATGGQFARSALLPWGASVDLFFVISGFIMVHASARLFGQPGARADFLKRRLVRIVPLYWLVTTLFVLLLAWAALKGGDPLPTVQTIFASYAFFPADTYGDGRVFPVFDLGWTLNYEMFFYLLLLLVIAWPRTRALAAIGIMMAALVCVGTLLKGPPAVWFWTRPIIVDFGLGVVVGALVGRRVVIPPAIRVILAVLGMALLLADPVHIFNGPLGSTVANAWPRVLLAGLPITAIMAAALLGPEPPLPRAGWPIMRIGDASYSLYLFHPFALILMEKLAQKLAIVRTAPGWTLVFATVLGALIIAFAAYRWIERPMTTALTRLLVLRPPVLPPIIVAP